jgi:hypothetical protein
MLHGTEKTARIQAISDARYVLLTARYALIDIAPNGRDYDAAGLQVATAAHKARVAAIEAIEAELYAEMEKIDAE